MAKRQNSHIDFSWCFLFYSLNMSHMIWYNVNWIGKLPGLERKINFQQIFIDFFYAFFFFFLVFDMNWDWGSIKYGEKNKWLLKPMETLFLLNNGPRSDGVDVAVSIFSKVANNSPLNTFFSPSIWVSALDLAARSHKTLICLYRYIVYRLQHYASIVPTKCSIKHWTIWVNETPLLFITRNHSCFTHQWWRQPQQYVFQANAHSWSLWVCGSVMFLFTVCLWIGLWQTQRATDNDRTILSPHSNCKYYAESITTTTATTASQHSGKKMIYEICETESSFFFICFRNVSPLLPVHIFLFKAVSSEQTTRTTEK